MAWSRAGSSPCWALRCKGPRALRNFMRDTINQRLKPCMPRAMAGGWVCVAGNVARAQILGTTRSDSAGNTITTEGSTMSILAWIIFGGLAGFVASRLTGGGGGMIFDIVVGIVGAVLGGFLMNQFGQSGVTGWNWPSFGVAVLGAVVLLVILRVVRGGGGGFRGRRR